MELSPTLLKSIEEFVDNDNIGRLIYIKQIVSVYNHRWIVLTEDESSKPHIYFLSSEEYGKETNKISLAEHTFGRWIDNGYGYMEYIGQ